MQKTTKIILLIISLLMLSSCVTTTTNIDVPGVFLQEPDAFSQGVQKYKSTNFYIKKIKFGEAGYGTGRLCFSKSSNEELRYIETMYFSDDWIFVNKIKFLIDGVDIHEYTSEPNQFRKIYSKNVEENNKFIVSNKLFQRILYSGSVLVRLMGSHYYIEKVIDGNELYLLKTFIRYTNNL